MSITSWLSSMFQPRRRPIRKATRHTTRLSVESLEDRLVPAPVNDLLGNAITLSGTSVTTTGTNRRATGEAGELNIAASYPTQSVWWTWTAPISASFTIDTVGSNFNTGLIVWDSNPINNFYPVAY